MEALQLPAEGRGRFTVGVFDCAATALRVCDLLEETEVCHCVALALDD